MVSKLKNSNCDKTQKLKLGHTQILIKQEKTQIEDYEKRHDLNRTESERHNF